MMRSLGTLLSLILSAVVAATSASAVPCSADDWGGSVDQIIREAPGGKGAIVLGAGLSPVPRALAEGDVLCGGETVINPLGSGLRTELSLVGGAIAKVGAGQTQPVPHPTFWARTADRLKAFNDFFGASVSRQPSLTRGGYLGLTEEIVGIAAWGPLILTWPEEEGRGPWSVRLNRDNSRFIAKVYHAFASIDLARDCPVECAIEIIAASGQRVKATNVRNVPASDAPLPLWLGHFSGRDDDRALLGGWLTTTLREDRWNDQGQSLLWSAACNFPAVRMRLVIRQKNGIGSPTTVDVCKIKALMFRSI